MLILDTHALLWFLENNPKIPNSLRERIENTENVGVSIGSFWEIAIKSGLGKLKLSGTISDMMQECAKMNIFILRISAADLDALTKLPDVHRDPFDRLIVSQTMVRRAILATVDQYIVKYPIQTIWD